MSYTPIQVPPLVSEKGKGRPKKYTQDTLPVSFRVPKSLRERGSRRAKKYRVNLTELLSIHYENFVNRPIEESLELIRKWREDREAMERAQEDTDG